MTTTVFFGAPAYIRSVRKNFLKILDDFSPLGCPYIREEEKTVGEDAKFIELYRSAIDRLRLDPDIAQELLHDILEALRSAERQTHRKGKDKEK